MSLLFQNVFLPFHGPSYSGERLLLADFLRSGDPEADLKQQQQFMHTHTYHGWVGGGGEATWKELRVS